MQHTSFQINAPYIVHETIEGETIIMNLKDGNYYSFDGIGPLVWELISKGSVASDIIRIFREVFPDGPENLDQMVNALVKELCSNEIILERKDATDPPHTLSADDVRSLAVFKEIEVRRPLFHRYSDMQDILLLDPIHDVDAKGWPEPKIRS
jgi:hypothetical protein